MKMKVKEYKNVTLEMSLKPFTQTDDDFMRGVISQVFADWSALTKDADCISVLLWTSDGSEILEWTGELDREMEWCRYVGGANRLEPTGKWDPEGIGLHSRAYYYRDGTSLLTYGVLKRIVELIKEVGKSLYPCKNIRVGETFDPGPEFAISSFKYERHNEICRGNTMGFASMVCCYATLHADEKSYAAFPDGIPEGLSLATFLGKQAQSFLPSMGFDYLWLSNGFGFGMEPWSTTGAVFDGKSFHAEELDAAKEAVLRFWREFRQEFSLPVEVRGTNLTAGIDLATDGVPLKEIYEGGFDILPPPNSPWAALDGNFGLELAGYLSRISQLPSEDYLFRFYLHDPWWANTPWTDRYDSLPHDIYLPMSLSRIDGEGRVTLPSHLAILSIDNSFGEMPMYCAHEVTTHIMKARRYSPDGVAPVIWVYPFAEYHSATTEQDIKEAFFGDWFITGAINHGLPIGAVMSTDSFTAVSRHSPDLCDGSVLVTVVPKAGSDFERALLSHIARGGKVIFYGSARHASRELLDAVGIKITNDAIFGEMDFVINTETDKLTSAQHAVKINHRPLTCADGMCAIASGASDAQILALAGGRVAAIRKDNCVWLEGTTSADYIRGRLLSPDDEQQYYSGESLMRKALDSLGISIRFNKRTPEQAEPILTLSRHDNAFMLAACAKDTTVTTRLHLPHGAPVFCGREALIDNEGFSVYHFSRAEFLECRIFVEQEEGVVSCHDINAGSFFRCRRIKLTGLKNATVRFFAPLYCSDRAEAILNSDDSAALVSESYDSAYITDGFGTYLELRGITGKLIFAIPFEHPKGSTERIKNNVPSLKNTKKQ